MAANRQAKEGSPDDAKAPVMPRRDAGGLRALAGWLPKAAGAAWSRRGFAVARLISEWPVIVGPALADSALPLRLARRDDAPGVLTLRVRPAAALEFQHLEPLLIERINSYFGFAAVGRLKLMQGPVAVRPRPVAKPAAPLPVATQAAIATRLDGVTDPDLRTALADLAGALARRNARR